MALEPSNSEAICWAERATADGIGRGLRKHHAFTWNEEGQRVRSTDSRTGAPLIERVALSAHYGSNLTGVSLANIKSTMKVLRHDQGVFVDVRISNGPAHIVEGDDRYELSQRRKGRSLGWIPEGDCPAALVAHGLIPAHTVLAPDAADGKPCDRSILGIARPPCRHMRAEMKARGKWAAERHEAREEANKSEEARLMASNSQNTAATAIATVALLEKQSETNAAIVALLAQRQPDAKEKPSK